MDSPQSGLDREEKTTGFLQERLWVLLLPALVTLAVIGATWICLVMRERDEVGQVQAIEHRLKRAVHALAGDLGHAVQQEDRERYTLLVETLATVTGGRVELHGERGAQLAVAGEPVRPERTLGDSVVQRTLGDSVVQGTLDDGVVQGDVSRSILVWGPAKDSGGGKVAEIRLHVRYPDDTPFPWSVWAGLLAVFGLIAAVILSLVTRVLAPLAKLGRLFRDIATQPPSAVQVPSEHFAEFGQLRHEIADCVDALRARQGRAEESFVEVAFSLAREYEYHREGSIGHGQRTRRYASWIAERLRLPPEERDALEVASLCHDIGRIPIDDSQRWSVEGDIERLHPVAGAAFFEAMPGLEDVARIIAAHHENFDGSGFPEGLAGEQIPVGARILRIADAFERHYSERGSSMTLAEALDEMEESKGREFDPYLFDFFREEATVHMLERRRLRVTLKAYQAGKASKEARHAEVVAED